jgi:hypothetical protein
VIDETMLRRLIQRELDARDRRQETVIGTIVGVPDTNRFALVQLGDTTRPVPVYRPALAATPVEGDRVAIRRGPEGYLVIEQVLDRDADVYVPPEEDDERDLAWYVELGLASTEALDLHAATGHLRRYNTPNSLAAYDGYWSQMATGVIPERYGSVAFEALLGGQGSNSTTWIRGRIRGRIRQQDDFGDPPTVDLELLDAGDITGADIAVVVTDDAGPTTFGLWISVTREYEWAEWTPLWTRRDRCDFTWLGCQAFVSALPSGDDTTATEV